MVVCLFAFLSLMAIWYHIGKQQNDRGQVWLALSILCWSISGAFQLYFGLTSVEPHLSLNVSIAKSLLSLLNSLFILLALPWFRHLPTALSPIIKSKYWTIIIGLPFIFSMLPTLSKIFIGKSNALISELDVYYSILTLLILGWVLWQSFVKRRLFLLAVLSATCIGITFIAQIYKLTDNNIDQLLFSAIFKSSLIMLFFALALSWVKDLTESLHKSSGVTKMNLRSERQKNGKQVHTLALSGIFHQDKELSLSPTHFHLLKKFAQRLKEDPEGWLEIKPKADKRSGKVYDINDYNEIKRMLHAILDAQLGKGSWSKEHHEKPLKDLLIEKSPDRERKVRLALSPEQVSIDA